MINETWLTPKQLSSLIPFKISTIYSYIERDAIPFKNFGKGKKPRKILELNTVKNWIDEGCPINHPIDKKERRQ